MKNIPLLIGFHSLRLGVLLSLVQIVQAASFINTGAMTIGRDYATATLLPDGKVLVAGGWNGSALTNEADIYDPVAGAWTNTRPMTTNRAHHAAVLLTNGTVLIIGGLFSSGNPLSSSEIYDPATGVWTATTNSLPNPCWDHTATLLSSGKVLVAGGNINVSPYFLSSAALYDPSTGAWKATGSMVKGRDLHSATLLPSGQVLVAGGMGGTNSAELYDPTTEKWTLTGVMADVHWNHTATLLPNGKVLVVGGLTNQLSFGVTASAKAEIYNPATGTWSQASPMKTPRVFQTATVLPNGKVLIAGGSSNYPTSLSSSEIYEPSTGSWLTNALMNRAHMLHTATLLTNGQVLIAGGYSNSVILSSAEIYASSNVIVMPIWLSSPKTISGSGGLVELAFTNIPDMSFIAYGSTNILTPAADWTVFDGPVETAPGQYLLSGLPITNAPHYFYRVRVP
jgi:hypothetical protein